MMNNSSVNISQIIIIKSNNMDEQIESTGKHRTNKKVGDASKMRRDRKVKNEGVTRKEFHTLIRKAAQPISKETSESDSEKSGT